MKNIGARANDSMSIARTTSKLGSSRPQPDARPAIAFTTPTRFSCWVSFAGARDLGFTIEQIRALVSLTVSEDRDCVEARDIAKSHLDSVRAKMIELMTLERSLSRFVNVCTATCAGGPASECTILKDLGFPDTGSIKQARCCR